MTQPPNQAQRTREQKLTKIYTEAHAPTTEGACMFLGEFPDRPQSYVQGSMPTLIKHDQGRDSQDEREDTAILTVLVCFFVVMIIGALCFAIGYWIAN